MVSVEEGMRKYGAEGERREMRKIYLENDKNDRNFLFIISPSFNSADSLIKKYFLSIAFYKCY